MNRMPRAIDVGTVIAAQCLMSFRILIVEDEIVLGKNLSQLLRRDGFHVEFAVSIEQANEALRAAPYDLLCLDVHLGDGDGLDLARQVREHHPGLLIVIMTGQDSALNRSRSNGVDCDAFITKPFPMSQFRELIKKLATGENPDTSSDPADQQLSVMMYSHDSIGLGHTRRNLNIAEKIVQELPNASVLMCIGGQGGAIFDLPAGVDFVKLPAITKVASQKFYPSKLRISQSQTWELRSSLLLRTAELFQPQVLLVDHVPDGVCGELLPTLKYLKSHPANPKIFLGLRDILDLPESVQRRWQADETDRVIADYYDQVLVYGSPEIFDTVSAYRLDSIAPGRTRYCGYVLTDEQAEPPETTGWKRAIGQRPKISVIAGGGSDAYPMMRLCLEALASMPRWIRPEASLIAGPLMHSEHLHDLQCQAAEIGATVLRSVPSCLPYIASSDLVVTMGGYNTMIEAAHFGKSTLVIPRVGPSSEQRMRAERFAALGLADYLPLEDASPEAVAAAIKNGISGQRRKDIPINIEGAQCAADAIRAALQPEAGGYDFTQLALCEAI